MDANSFRDSVLGSDGKKFVRNELFGPECWLFEQANLIAPHATYNHFKQQIGELIDINPNEVSLVGSSKFGFSMAPKKAWKPFDPSGPPKGSDLDCAIISETLYRSIVSQVRKAFFEGYSHLHERHAGQVFAGHVVLSTRDNYKSKYLKSTSQKMAELQRVVSASLRFEPDIKYRIYESFSVAEAYHIEGLKKLVSQETEK